MIPDDVYERAGEQMAVLFVASGPRDEAAAAWSVDPRLRQIVELVYQAGREAVVRDILAYTRPFCVLVNCLSCSQTRRSGHSLKSSWRSTAVASRYERSSRERLPLSLPTRKGSRAGAQEEKRCGRTDQLTRAEWQADCDAWGLTPAQYIGYLSRLSRYHANRARRHADRAVRLARISGRLGLLASMLAVVLLAVALMK